MKRVDCITERMEEIREETIKETKIESGINALENGASMDLAVKIAGISQEKLKEEYAKFLAKKS